MQTNSSARGFLAIAGVIILVPIFLVTYISITTREEKEEQLLRTTLSIVRQAIDAYKFEHGGEYPEMILQLTKITDHKGNVLTEISDDQFNYFSLMVQGESGPYIRHTPPNPVDDSNAENIVSIMPDDPIGGGGWIYCPQTGEFRANILGVAPSGKRYFDL
jgi:hypothetical protein